MTAPLQNPGSAPALHGHIPRTINSRRWISQWLVALQCRTILEEGVALLCYNNSWLCWSTHAATCTAIVFMMYVARNAQKFNEVTDMSHKGPKIIHSSFPLCACMESEMWLVKGTVWGSCNPTNHPFRSSTAHPQLRVLPYGSTYVYLHAHLCLCVAPPALFHFTYIVKYTQRVWIWKMINKCTVLYIQWTPINGANG